MHISDMLGAILSWTIRVLAAVFLAFVLDGLLEASDGKRERVFVLVLVMMLGLWAGRHFAPTYINWPERRLVLVRGRYFALDDGTGWFADGTGQGDVSAWKPGDKIMERFGDRFCTVRGSLLFDDLDLPDDDPLGGALACAYPRTP